MSLFDGLEKALQEYSNTQSGCARCDEAEARIAKLEAALVDSVKAALDMAIPNVLGAEGRKQILEAIRARGVK